LLSQNISIFMICEGYEIIVSWKSYISKENVKLNICILFIVCCMSFSICFLHILKK